MTDYTWYCFSAPKGIRGIATGQGFPECRPKETVSVPRRALEVLLHGTNIGGGRSYDGEFQCPEGH